MNIKISKKQWEQMGKEAGWIKKEAIDVHGPEWKQASEFVNGITDLAKDLRETSSVIHDIPFTTILGIQARHNLTPEILNGIKKNFKELLEDVWSTSERGGY